MAQTKNTSTVYNQRWEQGTVDKHNSHRQPAGQRVVVTSSLFVLFNISVRYQLAVSISFVPFRCTLQHFSQMLAQGFINILMSWLRALSQT